MYSEEYWENENIQSLERKVYWSLNGKNVFRKVCFYKSAGIVCPLKALGKFFLNICDQLRKW
jgi:hypothetical protein